MKIRLPSVVRHRINQKAKEITEFEEEEICHNFCFFKYSTQDGNIYGLRPGKKKDLWTKKRMTDTYLEQVFMTKPLTPVTAMVEHIWKR